jgi:glycosyltransferase involved in cell wall biosynthesis
MRYITFDLEEAETSGKHKFISRLRVELAKRGYIDPPEGETPDIHLYTRKWNTNSKHNVYRIDGICVNSALDELSEKGKTCRQANTHIRDKLVCASGVVFQNTFCKEAVDRIIGNKRYGIHACIMNGVDPSEFDCEPMKHERPYFMSLCKWRPHKRLSSIVEGFIKADLGDVDLLIYGETEKKVDHPHVIYQGWHPKSHINSAIKGCVSTVHLSWLDWCPNAIVESIVAGKQVIYTNSGGSPLVAKGRGYEIKDASWDFLVHDLYHSPELNIKEVAAAYREALTNPVSGFDSSDLYISGVADQYVELFESVSKVDNADEKRYQRISEERRQWEVKMFKQKQKKESIQQKFEATRKKKSEVEEKSDE